MRRSPRNLRIACNHAGLTHFGGICFFHEFLRVLQFRHFLARQLVYPRRNSRYTVPQMILALVYPIVLGLDRIETASFLRSNGTFQYLTGLQSFPDPQTLRRFLLQAPPRFWEQLHRVNDRLLQNFIPLPEHRQRQHCTRRASGLPNAPDSGNSTVSPKCLKIEGSLWK